MSDIEDVVIIGGGPAGLAAGLYTARADLKPLIFAGSPPGGQLTLTTEVENYLGFESILGPDLIHRMRAHVEKFGTRLIDENVLKVDFTSRPFKIVALDRAVETHAVIIATGAKAIWLNLESEQRLRGKGVSACATCDAFFFREKTVAVVGGGDTAMEEALVLTKFASKVYIIHRRDAFRASKIMQERVKSSPKVKIIWNTEVIEVLGENKVEGLKVQDTENKKQAELKVNGLFLAIGHKPDTDIFKGSIELDQQGYVVTHEEKIRTTRTSVEGVFAAGDCVDHLYRQAATAAGMGVAAALDVERWLTLQK